MNTEKIYESYVLKIMKLVDDLGNATGSLIAIMNNDGKEVDDEIFDLINDLKDGYDDIDEAVRTIMSK